MKRLHNNQFNLIHDNKIEPEDKEDLNLFIFCMYFLALELFLGLLLYIYMYF